MSSFTIFRDPMLLCSYFFVHQIFFLFLFSWSVCNECVKERHSGEIKEESISLDSPLVAVKLYHPHKLKPIKSTQSHIELILEKISTKIKNILQSTPTSSPSSLTLETTKLSQNDQESSENINLVVASGLGFAFLFR
jgi:hypothetical protein